LQIADLVGVAIALLPIGLLLFGPMREITIDIKKKSIMLPQATNASL
jgi:hypothetical protein